MPELTQPLARSHSQRYAARVKRLAPLLIAATIIAYGYNVARNVRAQRINDDRCASLADETQARIGKVGPWLDPLFAEDATWLRETLSANLIEMCGTVHARLTWWHWNFATEMAFPSDPDREARLRTTLARAHNRCPTVEAQLFGDLPGAADMLPKFCAIIDSLDPTRPRTPFSPWSQIF